jgi:hypothetical protein
MPEPMIRNDRAAGKLQILTVPELRSGVYSMFAIHGTDRPPGPAAAWIIEALAGRPIATG